MLRNRSYQNAWKRRDRGVADVLRKPWGGLFDSWRPMAVAAASAKAVQVAKVRRFRQRADPAQLELNLPLTEDELEELAKELFG